MTERAKGPNGRLMLSLSKDEKAANEQQAAVFLNGLHDNADTTSLDGKLKRDKIKDDEMLAWKEAEIVEDEPTWWPELEEPA